MNKYAIVPQSQFTSRMLYESNSKNINEVPTHTTKTYFLWLFPLSTVCYVFEFNPDKTKAFDNFRWFSEDEMRDQIIKDNAS